MATALLLGASAVRSHGGPVVRLPRGSYRLLVQGRIDTELFYRVMGEAILNRLEHFHLLHTEEPIEIQVTFGDRGVEESISIFAERVT